MRVLSLVAHAQISMPNSEKSSLSPRTVSSPASATTSDSKWELRFDGASRDSSTRGGTGAILKSPDGTLVKEMSDNIGPATSNEAEYKALNSGMEEALKQGCKEIQVFGDSNLVVKQVKGDWRVSAPNLKPLYDKVVDLSKKFKRFEIDHVPRQENVEADRLASRGVENQGTDKLVHYTPEYGEMDSGSEDYEDSLAEWNTYDSNNEQAFWDSEAQWNSEEGETASEDGSYYEDIGDGDTKCVSSYNDESDYEYLPLEVDTEPLDSPAEEDPDMDETESQSEQSLDSKSDDDSGSDGLSADSSANTSEVEIADGQSESEDSVTEAAESDDSVDGDGRYSVESGYATEEFSDYDSD